MAWALLIASFCLVHGRPVAAQHVPEEEKAADRSRAEVLREQREEKENELDPPEDDWLEDVALFIERNQVILDFPDIYLYGVRPIFGGLRSGSGTAAGLRFEPTRSGSPFMAAVEGQASLRRYWQVQGVGGYETGPFIFYGFGRYRHLPQEPFYGIGPSSSGDESTFTWDEGLAGGLVALHPVDGFIAGVTGAYQTNDLGSGEADEHPTLDAVADEYGRIPGFDGAYAEVDYTIFGAFVELDRRDTPFNARYGSRFAPSLRGRSGLSLDAREGIYAAFNVTRNVPTGEGQPYSFTRYEADLQQYIPFQNGYRALALREFVSVVDADADSEVPFYRMNTLGGGRSLRGFDTFRFRDRNVALLNAEYRWWVWVRLDMALFVDAGYVFHDVDEITLREAEVGYGVGLRYRTSSGIAARLEVAHSRQGPRMYIKLGGIL